jgi:hypothetical protein
VPVEILDRRDRIGAASQDHIPFVQPRVGRRAVRLDRQDEHARWNGEALQARLCAGKRHGLTRDANVAAPDPAVANQPRRDEPRGVARDGEAEALRGNHGRGIDADHVAARVHERSSRVARVERRVGLNDVVHQPPGARAQRAAEGADDAGGDRMLQAVGIADGNRHLSDAHRLRVAERRPRQRRAFGADPQDGQVGVNVAADQVGPQRPAIGQQRGEPGGSRHDVAVGEDKAVGREDHPGTSSSIGIDFHHCRPDLHDGLCHRPGVGVEKVVVMAGVGAMFGIRDHGPIVRTWRPAEITRSGGIGMDRRAV